MLFDPPVEKNKPVADSVPDSPVVPAQPARAPATDPTKITKANSAIPGVTETGMFFETFIFNPSPSISKADLIEILKAAKLLYPASVFEKLPESAKEHFLRLDRTGAIHPYRRRRGQ